MTYTALMIEKYRSRGLLLDSNLLLLHLVGTVNASLVGVGGYGRLSGFGIRQTLILQQLIATFVRVVTTAHVLTEVSNLVNDLHGVRKAQVLGAFVSTLEMISEQDISSYKAGRRSEFSYLGLTDSVLTEMSGSFLIVSNDGRMVDMLRQHGVEALKWVEVLGLSAE